MSINYVDRVSAYRPSGVPSVRHPGGVAACLVHEVTEDEAKPFVCRTGPLDYKLPPPKTNIYRGFYSDVRECLQPNADRSFVDVLKNEFKETVYDSYWNKVVGKVADQTPMLPPGMNPITTCFGKPTPKDITAGELVNPPKSYLEVLEEARVGHDMYRQTHNDYEAGEQTNRNYIKPFNRDLVWGAPTPCDPHGGCMKKVMDIDTNDKIFVSKILAQHRKLNRPLVGKVLAPNNNIECVPKGHAFGKVNKRGAFGAGELLKDCPPSLDKVDLYEELSSINTLRQEVAKKEPSFSFRDLDDSFHQRDKENTGYLPIEQVYKVLAHFSVFPDKYLFEQLMKRLNILLENGLSNYEKLADCLNVHVEFPDVSKIEDVPKEMLNFETTYQIAHKYHCSDDYASTKTIPTAGKPSDPHLAIDGLVSPSIFSSYGLTPRDFFVSRTPKFICTLLKKIGCVMDKNKFEEIWTSAKDGKGCVSVQSFWDAMKNFKN